MSDNLELPDWARNMTDPPRVTMYAGPLSEYVMWRGGPSRRTYRIEDSKGCAVHLNVQQAAAVVEMIFADLEETDDDD